MPGVNREHKDRLFSFLFGNKSNREWTLSLYNAVNHTKFTNPEDIQFTTIEDAVYMGMKNDLSFILFYVMNIYEQQSNFNPNMPVRQLMYAGKLYDKFIQINGLNIYGKKIVHLPVPKLVVFYNGTDEREDTILALSDSFDSGEEFIEPDIEVKVKMININQGQNTRLMAECQPLAEYAWLIEQIRRNREEMDIEKAVDKAINDMPQNYIIRPFLIGNRAEVKDMCITEYNEAETMKMFREEGRKEGIEEGEEELGKLVSLLISVGRGGEVQTVVINREVREALYKEFNIV